MKIQLYLISLLFLACQSESKEPFSGKFQGYKPVYKSYEEMAKVNIGPARKLISPGKIYVKGNFLFVNEANEGVHVINNANPSKPTPISFIAIPGNNDIEIKDNTMFADNGLDLVAIDLGNPESVKILKRLEKIFPYPTYPPFQNVKFECADPAKGYVVGWTFEELIDPKCSR